MSKVNQLIEICDKVFAPFYIAYAISSGRVFDWNTKLDKYISPVYEKATELYGPERVIFRYIMECTSYSATDIIGPSRGRKRILKIDIKKIPYEHVAYLCNILIWMNVGIAMRLFPKKAEVLFSTCRDLIGENNYIREILPDFIKEDEYKPDRFLDKIYTHICEVFYENRSINQSMQIYGKVAFFILMMSNMTTTIRIYKEAIDGNSGIEGYFV